jgi:hypothetical protein
MKKISMLFGAVAIAVALGGACSKSKPANTTPPAGGGTEGGGTEGGTGGGMEGGGYGGGGANPCEGGGNPCG